MLKENIQTYVEDNPWLRKAILGGIACVVLWFPGQDRPNHSGAYGLRLWMWH